MILFERIEIVIIKSNVRISNYFRHNPIFCFLVRSCVQNFCKILILFGIHSVSSYVLILQGKSNTNYHCCQYCTIAKLVFFESIE